VALSASKLGLTSIDGAEGGRLERDATGGTVLIVEIAPLSPVLVELYSSAS